MAINAAFNFVLLGTDVNTRNYSHLKAKEMLGLAKTMSLSLWVGLRNILRDIQKTDRLSRTMPRSRHVLPQIL
jgi:hypothetical protein